VEEVGHWTTTNKMPVSYTESKEMVLGQLAPNPPPLLYRGPDTIPRVTQFKLLGLFLSSDLAPVRDPY